MNEMINTLNHDKRDKDAMRNAYTNEEAPIVEVVKSLHQSWAFTIKRTGKNLNKTILEDYSAILQKFNNSGIVKIVEHEEDQAGVLHLHGIVLLRKGFLRKLLCLSGFHVKLVEIYDEFGWTKYIQKKYGFMNTDYAF